MSHMRRLPVAGVSCVFLFACVFLWLDAFAPRGRAQPLIRATRRKNRLAPTAPIDDRKATPSRRLTNRFLWVNVGVINWRTLVIVVVGTYHFVRLGFR